MSIVSRSELNGGEPTLEPGGVVVARLVDYCYAVGPQQAQTHFGGPPIAEAEVLAAITYCADRACDTALARCAGCRLRTEADGIESLDGWCQRAGTIEVEQSGLRIVGGSGTQAARVPSLEDLARTWSGEEYWFLARRVLRRLRREETRAAKGAMPQADRPTPAFVLVAPQMADNIGMVARAMANFALDELRLVAPRDGWPNEKARAAASGAHAIIDDAVAYGTTQEAIGDLHWVCATTARQRELAKPVMSFEMAVGEMRRRLAAGQRCGVLFGPERAGLESDDVALADAIVMAPVNPRFASINLAQSVLLMGYEWFKGMEEATLGRVTQFDQAGEARPHTHGTRPASRSELIGFFEHLERELDAKGFLFPPHKRPVMVRNMRTMFERMEATEQEVRTLRGIVAALVHGKRWGRSTTG